jgi:hypothetical protein
MTVPTFWTVLRRHAAKFGVGVLTADIQDGDGIFGRQAPDPHLPRLGLLSHFVRHRQPALDSGSDHQAAQRQGMSSMSRHPNRDEDSCKL